MSLFKMLVNPTPTLRQHAKKICRDLRRAQTHAEQLLWEALRDRKLEGLKFYRQYLLFVEWSGTKTFFVADFFCFERQPVVEVDGKVHDYRIEHDKLRTLIINHLGIRVVRVRNAEIETDLVGVVKQLRETASNRR